MRLALLTVAETLPATDLSEPQRMIARATTGGHKVLVHAVVKNEATSIREQLVKWNQMPEVDVIIVWRQMDRGNAKTVLLAMATGMRFGIAPIVGRLEALGVQTTTIASPRNATKLAFVLPVGDGRRPAADALVGALDELAGPAPPVVAPASDAVPAPIAAEKTAGGAGPSIMRLPAGNAGRANVVSRLPAVPPGADPISDPATRPIDVEHLERQIALSNAFDAETKPIDLEALGKAVSDEIDAAWGGTETVETKPAPPQPSMSGEFLEADLVDDAVVTPPVPVAALPAAKAPVAAPAKPAPIGVPKTLAPVTKPVSSIAATPPVGTPALRPTSTPLPSIRGGAATTPAPVAPMPAKPAAVAAKSAVETLPYGKVEPPKPVEPPKTIEQKKPAFVPEAPKTIETKVDPKWPNAEPKTEELDLAAATVDTVEQAAPPVKPAPPPPVPPPVAPPAPPVKQPRTRPPTPPPISTAAAAAALVASLAPVVAPEPPKPAPPKPAPDATKLERPKPTLVAAPLAPPAARPVAAFDDEPRVDLAPLPGKPRKKQKKRVWVWPVVIAAPVLGLGIAWFLDAKVFSGKPDDKKAPIVAVAPIDAAPGVAPAIDAPPPTSAPAIDAAEAEIELPPTTPPPTNPPPTNNQIHTPPNTTHNPPPNTTHNPPPTNPPPTNPPPDAGTAAPPLTPPPDAPAAVVAEGCDEMSCVTNNYAEACCEKYRPKGGKFVPHSTDETPRAAELDLPLIREGVATVKAGIFACGDKHPDKHGTVRVAVVVAPPGSVTSTNVLESPDSDLGTCVADALRRAKFPPTSKGGNFKYPISF